MTEICLTVHWQESHTHHPESCAEGQASESYAYVPPALLGVQASTILGDLQLQTLICYLLLTAYQTSGTSLRCVGDGRYVCSYSSQMKSSTLKFLIHAYVCN